MDAEELIGARLHLAVTNTGKRPVTVVNWEGKYREPRAGKAFVTFAAGNLPKTLKESETVDELNEAFDVFERGLASMYVTDSSGRTWKLPRRDLKRLAAEYERLKAVNVSGER